MAAFQSPNYTQTPNDFFEIIPQMEETELRVTLIMVRHTFGYHREGFKMSIEKLAKATGLSRNGAKAGAEAAEQRGTFRRTNPEAQGSAEWELVVHEPGQPVPPQENTHATSDQLGGQSVTTTPATSDLQLGLNKGKEKKKINTRPVSEETRTAILSNPSWAIAAGVDYVQDPEQVALLTIRETWDSVMRTNAPWERWSSFDKWLLEQERNGNPAEVFCKWFVSDKFRRESVGMWTPNGKAQGQWSFKNIYPQAFPKKVEIQQTPWTGVNTEFAHAVETYVPRQRPQRPGQPQA